MITMIRRTFVAATVATTLFALTAMTQAQTTQTTPPPPPQQYASSTAGVTGSAFTGDQWNGGGGFFDGQGTGNAMDPNKASTNAATSGAGTGSQTLSNTKMTSTASGILSTFVTATGASTNAVLNGSGGQYNYVTLNADPLNFSNAGSSTSGNFQGTVTAGAPLTATGSAGGDGNSESTVNGGGTNSATSTDKTTGTSNGTMGFTTTDPNATSTLSSGVNGSGAAQAQSFTGDPSKVAQVAGSWNLGTASYSAQNPLGSTTGMLTINGVNNATIGPNGATASSVNSSTASVKH